MFVVVGSVAGVVLVGLVFQVEYVGLLVVVVLVSRLWVSHEDSVDSPFVGKLLLVSHWFYDYTVFPLGLLLVKCRFRNRYLRFESSFPYHDSESTLADVPYPVSVQPASPFPVSAMLVLQAS